jgi:hypothetical protein
VAQFSFHNKYQARIVYEWCKYFSTDFATAGTGDFELSLRSQFFTQPLITGWQFLKDTLLEDLTKKIAVKTWAEFDCTKSIKGSAMQITDSIAKEFCGDSNKWVEKSIETLIHYCMYSSNVNYKTLMKPLGLNKIQALELCEDHGSDDETNPESHSTGAMIIAIEKSLAKQYGCKKNGSTSCSRYELAAIQISSSKVTLSPPTELDKELKPSNTAKEWYPNSDMLPGAIEFKAVEPKLKTPTPEQALKLFHWDNLLA